jgi:hypothetical protein
MIEFEVIIIKWVESFVPIANIVKEFGWVSDGILCPIFAKHLFNKIYV